MSSADRSPSPIRGMLPALLAALLAITAKLGCCGLPILAALLGVFGVSSSAVNGLKPFQPLFIALSIAGLGYGFYAVYGRKGRCACASRKGRTLSLWACTVLVLGLLASAGLGLEPAAVDDTDPAEAGSCCPAEAAPAAEDVVSGCCPVATPELNPVPEASACCPGDGAAE